MNAKPLLVLALFVATSAISRAQDGKQAQPPAPQSTTRLPIITEGRGQVIAQPVVTPPAPSAKPVQPPAATPAGLTGPAGTVKSTLPIVSEGQPTAASVPVAHAGYLAYSANNIGPSSTIGTQSTAYAADPSFYPLAAAALWTPQPLLSQGGTNFASAAEAGGAMPMIAANFYPGANYGIQQASILPASNIGGINLANYNPQPALQGTSGLNRINSDFGTFRPTHTNANFSYLYWQR